MLEKENLARCVAVVVESHCLGNSVYQIPLRVCVNLGVRTLNLNGEVYSRH